jgi:hypothetical protein
MAEIDSLIYLNQLHWDYPLNQAKTSGGVQMRYDDDADMFLLLFVSPELETVVFYLDDHVGLLIDPETMNVVGLQIEAFKYSFLPNHGAVDYVWRLSDAWADAKDYGDLVLRFDRTTRQMAREVIRATEDVLGEPAAELVAALG